MSSVYGQSAKSAKEYLQTRGEVYFSFPLQENHIMHKLSGVISLDNVKDKKVWAYANVKEYDRFLTFGIKADILTPPSLQKRSISMATTIEQMATWDRYPTYEVYVSMMEKFAADYPALCKLEEIGTTVGGRKLLVVKISDNVNTDEQEPEFFYTSTMHGDETTGFVNYLRLIEYLLENYNSDDRIKNIVDNVEVYINPNANPDGTYAGGNNTVVGATRSNANGIDLNRFFPDVRNGYFSDQPEITNMVSYAENRHFVMSANTHGGIELANYPWDGWTERHADDAWFQHVSRQYADNAQTNSPSNYFTGENNGITNGADWYVVFGSRQDYMNYYRNCKEITLEISNVKLLSSGDLPNYWTYNKEATLRWLEQVTYGVHGTVSNDIGEAVKVKVNIEEHDKKNSFVYSDAAVGDYHRLLAPGSYTLTYEAEGYQTHIEEITIDSYTHRIDKNISMLSASTFNFGGNVVDESNAPLEGVKIEILDSSIPAVYTNAQGEYILADVWMGQYQVRAYKEGYLASVKSFNLSSAGQTLDFNLVVSEALSFETEVPAGWTMSGAQGWARSNVAAFDGVYSLKSGLISDQESSIVELELKAMKGEISFYYKVSSEETFDFLKFYIDGEEKASWSGEIDWTQARFNVEEGLHVFKWEYVKDQLYGEGDDCAYIDFVLLPEKVESLPELITGTTDGITQSEASVKALINPDGATVEMLKFEYGLTTTYSGEHNIDVATIPDNELSTVSASIENLEANKTYHYRVVAQMNGEMYYGGDSIFKTLTTDINDSFNTSFDVYPNPAGDYLNIDLIDLDMENAVIKVYDMNGRVIISDSFNGEVSKQLDICKLSEGMYILEVRNCCKTIKHKILKN